MVIRSGVVGLGNMGCAHARVYDRLEGCKLVAVCDINPEKKYLAERYQCRFFKEAKDLLKEDLDAVSICTPTHSHRRIALEALDENMHILVEKPLATSVRDAERVLKRAKNSEILAVGYIERFNPAVVELKKNVDFLDIYSVVSLRFGPYPPRTKDIGVLLDLASHEIDTLSYLTKTQPQVLYAHVSNHSNSNLEDYAYISLMYGNIHSHIEASWLPSYKLRLINLYGNESFYSINYLQQEIKLCRAPPRSRIGSSTWQDILVHSRNINEDIAVPRAEPLELELKCFIESVEQGEIIDPLCSGEEGLEVLRVSEESLTKARGNM